MWEHTTMRKVGVWERTNTYNKNKNNNSNNNSNETHYDTVGVILCGSNAMVASNNMNAYDNNNNINNIIP